MRQVRKDGDKETLAPKMKKDDRKKRGMPAVFSDGWKCKRIFSQIRSQGWLLLYTSMWHHINSRLM